MTHKRNVKGLIKNAQQRREKTIKRTEKALKKMIKNNKKINFKRVAEEAEVSTAWLYKEEQFSKRIRKLRKQQKNYGSVEKKLQKTSDKSKDAMIMTMRTRIKSLKKENKKLKEQIEVLYGELYKNGS
jgi:metal-dependent amidase/aminoacylase/carboxypeptidase family protein